MTAPDGLFGQLNYAALTHRAVPSPAALAEAKANGPSNSSGDNSTKPVPEAKTVTGAGTGQGKRPYSERMGKTVNRGQGVGGSHVFSLQAAIVGANGVYKPDPYFPALLIELPPARRAFHEKQGQGVPGAHAGLSMKINANTARIPIPGAKPCRQQMGFGDETLEWVGAFVGFDHFIDDREDGNPEKRRTGSRDAKDLIHHMKMGRELILTLGWKDSNSYIEFDAGIQFCGYLRNLKVIEETEEKSYYQLTMVITNRNDIKIGTMTDSLPFDTANAIQDFQGLVSTDLSPFLDSAKTASASTPQNVKKPASATDAVHENFVTSMVKLGDVDRKITTPTEYLQFVHDNDVVEQILSDNPEYLKEPRIQSLRNIAAAKKKSYEENTKTKPTAPVQLQRKGTGRFSGVTGSASGSKK